MCETMKSSSPYLEFDRKTWQSFRLDTPMLLAESDLVYLHGQIESVSLAEIEAIYLALSRLLNLYVEATQKLYQVTTEFLGHPEPKVPYIIGIAGSVAVGKSTTSRILKALLSCWPSHPQVEIVTTDGFLFPNAYLAAHQLENLKGFPESYDVKKIIEFLQALKAGQKNIQVPQYSHHFYDIIPNQFSQIQKPDIVIVEGLNVLQSAENQGVGKHRVYVSDYFDFTIYVDAKISLVKEWFIQRFKRFRALAQGEETAFFYQFAKMSEQKALDFAYQVWRDINEKNLKQNILPYKDRARLILEKGENHNVKKVYLRKI